MKKLLLVILVLALLTGCAGRRVSGIVHRAYTQGSGSSAAVYAVLITDSGTTTIRISTAAYLTLTYGYWCTFEKNIRGEYELESCEPLRNSL